jgi:hypothetical protein
MLRTEINRPQDGLNKDDMTLKEDISQQKALEIIWYMKAELSHVRSSLGTSTFICAENLMNIYSKTW